MTPDQMTIADAIGMSGMMFSIIALIWIWYHYRSKK